jgi:hypothetical protein
MKNITERARYKSSCSAEGTGIYHANMFRINKGLVHRYIEISFGKFVVFTAVRMMFFFRQRLEEMHCLDLQGCSEKGMFFRNVNIYRRVHKPPKLKDDNPYDVLFLADVIKDKKFYKKLVTVNVICLNALFSQLKGKKVLVYVILVSIQY